MAARSSFAQAGNRDSAKPLFPLPRKQFDQRGMNVTLAESLFGKRGTEEAAHIMVVRGDLSKSVRWQCRVKYMPLDDSDKAPDFSATTYDGKQLSLSDYLGKRGLVIFFYPKDGTPVCTQEACAFRDSYEKFVEAGAEVIGVSSDPEDAHRSFTQQHKLSFPLISDFAGALRRAFGVPKIFGILPGRVTYVIDKQGIIRHIFSAQFASAEHVRQALSAIGVADLAD